MISRNGPPSLERFGGLWGLKGAKGHAIVAFRLYIFGI